MKKLLCLMGSGEIAPNMVKVHRKIINDLTKSFGQNDKLRAVSLATPYIFQENLQELSEKIVSYFQISLNLEITPIDIIDNFLSTDHLNYNQDELARQTYNANFIFAGPGSPSFALSRWEAGQLPNILNDKLKQGGAVVFSSAAALTLGNYTVPVYEIYKSGAKPFWLKGLNLLKLIGLNAAVIPHFNNAEGGTHDTRFCYLGQTRLNYLKDQMDEGSVILGIDEHTAVIFDLDNQTFEVCGLGTFTVEAPRNTIIFNSGDKASIDDLIAIATKQVRPAAKTEISWNKDSSANNENSTDNLESHKSKFKELLANKQYSNAGRQAALMLDQLTASNFAGDYKTLKRVVSTLKSMILNIFDDYNSLEHNSEALISNLTELLAKTRDIARKSGNYEVADLIREELLNINIQLNDSPSGTTWTILK